MTPDNLGLIGRYLYGVLWQSKLARAIGADDRLVRYWISGERQIPERRIEQILDLVRTTHVARAEVEEIAFRDLVATLPVELQTGLFKSV